MRRKKRRRSRKKEVGLDSIYPAFREETLAVYKPPLSLPESLCSSSSPFPSLKEAAFTSSSAARSPSRAISCWTVSNPFCGHASGLYSIPEIKMSKIVSCTHARAAVEPRGQKLLGKESVRLLGVLKELYTRIYGTVQYSAEQ